MNKEIIGSGAFSDAPRHGINRLRHATPVRGMPLAKSLPVKHKVPEFSGKRKSIDMFDYIIRAAIAGIILLTLQGCQDKAGEGPDTASAETTRESAVQRSADTFLPKGAYAPEGPEGATTIVRPIGNAIVTIVNGIPVGVRETPRDGEYDRIMLPPGEHVLHVGRAGTTAGLNMRFKSAAGDYYATGFDYVFDGDTYWTPVIVEGSPDGRVVADKDGLLVGKPLAEARKYLVTKLAQKPETADTSPKIDERREANSRAATHLQEGRAFFEQKKNEKALAAFDAALAIAPELDSALLYRGMTLIRLKRRKEALSSLDAAVAAGKKHRKAGDKWLAWPLYQRGVVLMSLRRGDEAARDFDDSIAASPTANALAARGNLNFSQGQALGKQEKWDDAEPFFKKAQADADSGIALAPKNMKLWSLKTATHIMLNEHEDACKSMRKACEFGNCKILEQFPQCKPGGS